MQEMLCAAIKTPGFTTMDWEHVSDIANSPSAVSSAAKPNVLYKTMTGPGGVSLNVYYGDLKSNVSPLTMDMSAHCVRRCITDTSQALAHFRLTPKQLVIHVNHGEQTMALQVTTTPTTQAHTMPLDIERPTSLSMMPNQYKESSGTMLCVSTLGLYNDNVWSESAVKEPVVKAADTTATVAKANATPQTPEMKSETVTVPPLHISAHKQLSMVQVKWTTHFKFGIHDVHYGQFSIPQICEYSKYIGQIHLMTQMGKAILKSRPEQTPEVAAVTTEQHGAHLKDEVRLCKYWTRIESLLTHEERACLDDGITAIKAERIRITPTLKDTSMAQACMPVTPNITPNKTTNTATEKFTERPPCKMQDLHHIRALVNIKASTMLPITRLRRESKCLNVRIDNDWDIEMNSIAYD
jgi:hypothetical protein